MADDDSIRDAALFDQGRTLVQSIVDLALALPAGGDARWDAMLGKFGVRGLSADERARHLKDGPGQSKGPLLIEMRWALDASVSDLAESMDDRWRLPDLCQRAVRDYAVAVKPRITTSSIFANALATTTNYMAGSAAADADSCTCCGATLADRSVAACRYCGEPLGART